MENGLLCGAVGLIEWVSAVLHPARPPKNARCHHWTSFPIFEKKKENVVFFHYSRVGCEEYTSLLDSKNHQMWFCRWRGIYISCPLFDEVVKTRRYPLTYLLTSLVPLRQKGESLTVCMRENDVNWQKKNILWCLFLCRPHSFGLVGTGLYSVSSSPGFPFAHISVASGSSSSYSHIIVAHLIISKKVLMYCTKKTTLHRLFLLAS